MDMHEYNISWRIFNGNECVAGGEAEYKGTTPANAKRRFMQDFNRQKAITPHTSFIVSDPVLSANDRQKQRSDELADLRAENARLARELEAARPLIEWVQKLSEIEPRVVGVISSYDMATETQSRADELYRDYRILKVKP